MDSRTQDIEMNGLQEGRGGSGQTQPEAGVIDTEQDIVGSLSDKLDMLREMRRMWTIVSAERQPNVADPATVVFPQVIGACSAVTFGIFTALSWSDARVSPTLARTGALFALIDLCAKQVRNLPDNCDLANYW